MLPTLLTHGGTFMAMAPSQPLRREKANTTCYPVQWFNGSILHILLLESPCGGLQSVQNGGGKCGRQGGGLGGGHGRRNGGGHGSQHGSQHGGRHVGGQGGRYVGRHGG